MPSKPSTHYYFPYKLVHEIDNEGDFRHRIVLYLPTGHKVKGDWMDYTHPAKLRFEERLFIAFTEYYSGSFPVEQVMRLETLP